MLDFDFDVVTGPSQASCPAAPVEPEVEEEQSSGEPARPERSANR